MRDLSISQIAVWTENATNIVPGNSPTINFEAAALPKGRLVRRVFLEVLSDFDINSGTAGLTFVSDLNWRNLYKAIITNLQFNITNAQGDARQIQLFSGPFDGDNLFGCMHTDLGVEVTAPTIGPRYGTSYPPGRSVVTPAVGHNSRFIHLQIPLIQGDLPGAGYSFGILTDQLAGAVLTWVYGTLSYTDGNGSSVVTIPKYSQFGVDYGSTTFRVVLEHSAVPEAFQGAELRGSPVCFRRRPLANQTSNVLLNPEPGLLLSCTMRNPTLTTTTGLVADSMAAFDPQFHTSASALAFQDEGSTDILIYYDGTPPRDANTRHMSEWAGFDRIARKPILGYLPDQLVGQTVSSGNPTEIPASRYGQPGIPLVWADPRDLLSTASEGKVTCTFPAFWTSGAGADAARYVEYSFVPPNAYAGAVVAVPSSTNNNPSFLQRVQAYLSKLVRRG